MRSGKAFTFITSLLGDFVHITEIINNPPELVLEAALETINAASTVFSAIVEHQNTELLEESAYRDVIFQIEKYANELATNREKLEYCFKEERNRLKEARFRSESTEKLAKMVSIELNRISNHIQELIANYDENDDGSISMSEIQTLYEIQRRTIRDYNRITKEILKGGN